LDGHPEIQCGGEGHFADWLGDEIYKVMDQYVGKMRHVNDFIYGDRATYIEPLKRRDVQFLARIAIGMVLSKLTIKPTAKWLGDKTPLYIQRLNFMRTAFPNARFVTIIRDPRDACVSMLNHAQRMRDKGLGQAANRSDNDMLESFLKSWDASIKAVQSFQAKQPGIMHLLRYEELYADTNGALKKALGFLDVDDSEAAIQACRDNGDFKSLTGGRAPGEEDKNSFFRKAVVGDWRENLSAEQVAMVQQMIKQPMEAMGYR
jgi:Sulfotransferase domain.